MVKYDKRCQLWYDSHELNEVVMKLFSKGLDDQQFALDILIGWKARKESKFPAAMDATIHLLNAQIQDGYMKEGHIPLNETTLEALFGFAMIRFINVIADKAQKGQYKMAMKKAADQFGIPEYMVEMRHDLSHYHIHSVSSLRHATLKALLWLRDNYWYKLKGKDSCQSSKKMDHRIKINLKKYQLYKQDNTLQNHRSDAIYSSNLCWRKLEFLIASCPLSFVKILATPKHLLSSRSNKSYFTLIKGPEKSESLELSDNAKIVWDPILNLVLKKRLLRHLVETLLLNQGRFSLEADAEIVAWVQYLLTLGEESLLVWDWLALLRLALKHPSKPVLSLLPLILGNMDPPLSNKKQSQLKELVSCYVGAFTALDNKKLCSSRKVYSPKDVQKLFHPSDLDKISSSGTPQWIWNPGAEPFLGTFKPGTNASQLLQPEEVPLKPHVRNKAKTSILPNDPDLLVHKPKTKVIRKALFKLLDQRYNL